MLKSRIKSHQLDIFKSSARIFSSIFFSVKICKINSFGIPAFIKLFSSFFLGSAKAFLIKSRNILSSKKSYKLCFSNKITEDSIFGAGIKFSFHTKITSLAKHFLATNKDNTLVFIFQFLSCHKIILSQTSFCIKISIFSGIFFISYKKCLKIGEVI